MSRSLVSSILARFRQRIGDVAVFRGRRECADGTWVRRSGDCEEKAHVGNVVEVDLGFEHDREAFAVQTDGEDSGGKGEFADN